ncbi:hypothetical protein ACU4GR_09705 (plasmid) [Methylobacterium oryzae CBMB20]
MLADRQISAARMIRRSRTTVIALGVIAGAAIVALLIHLLLGLLSLDIAVAKTSTEDREAAQALTQLFETQHPRVRIRTIFEPDRLGAAAALDKGETQLALVRSDAAPKDGADPGHPAPRRGGLRRARWQRRRQCGQAAGQHRRTPRRSEARSAPARPDPDAFRRAPEQRASQDPRRSIS